MDGGPAAGFNPAPRAEVMRVARGQALKSSTGPTYAMAARVSAVNSHHQGA